MSEVKTKDESEIFILTGHRKSGTSMFHRLFDGHSGITVYPVDICVLYAYFPCFTKNKNLSEENLRLRLKHVLKKGLYSQDILSKEEEIHIEEFIKKVNKRLNSTQIRNKVAVIKAIKDAWITVIKQNKDSLPFLFKETSQAIFFQGFKKSFPNLKMISLIRDPRDNYAAIKAGVSNYYSKMGESEKESLASVINRVRMDLKAAELNQKNYPKSFLAIKFEELLKNTEEIMQKITEFLNISFEETLLKTTIKGKPYKGNSHDGKVFSGISTVNLGRWKERIQKEEAMIIEYWLKDLMDFWEYPIEYEIEDSQKEFSKFYEWYNCHYFYHDSFKKHNKLKN